MKFKKIKKDFKKILSSISDRDKSYQISEAAFPSYAHKNPLIDFLFWKRIKIAYDYAKNIPNCKNVLDFGCGSGILTYMLAINNCNVVACDIEMEPLKMVQKQIDFPNNIKYIEGDILKQDLEKNSFDIIFAMDVLEHIENLDPYIDLFKNLLASNGVIVVSGPTENYLYNLGRKIAGKRFSGDYHVKNVYDVKKEFQTQWNIRTIKKLIYPFTLFEIFSAKNPQNNRESILSKLLPLGIKPISEFRRKF